MDKLNRDLQRTLLEVLAASYPEPVYADFLRQHAPGSELEVNIAYLGEHELVVATFMGSMDMGNQLLTAKITAKGLDFLADDGGLGAILGVLTIRLHEDSIKQLIARQIHASDLAPPDKKRYLDRLRELPAETTKHLVLKMVDAGLENWQKALPLLQNILG